MMESPVKGKWKFFTLSFLTVGAINLLVFFIFFMAYFGMSEGLNQDIEVLYLSGNLSLIYYYGSFGWALSYIFLVHIIHNLGGSRGTSFNFGAAFARLKFKTFAVYFIAYCTVLFTTVYFSVHTEYGFTTMNEDDLLNPMLLEFSELDWYIQMLYDGILYLIRLLPFVVVSLYALSLRNPVWNWKTLKNQGGKILATIFVLIAFHALGAFIWQMFANVIMGVLSSTIQNEVITLVINLSIYFVYSIVCFGIGGYLCYFIEFEWEEQVPEKAIEVDAPDVLLDQ